MTEKPKHTTIATYTAQDDGSISILTDSYFEELASRKEDRVVKIKTDHNKFLADYLAAVDVIQKHQTKDLVLRITVDEWGKPNLIIKQYTIRKESFKRR